MNRNLAPVILLCAALAGCGGPKYAVLDTDPIPPTAKVGVVEQVKCLAQCTSPDNPKIFTETLRARLEELLHRPVTVVPPITKMDQYGYYKPGMIAEVGKAGGIDFVVDAQLSDYTDPSSGSRAGSAVATTAGVVAGTAIGAAVSALTGGFTPIVTFNDHSKKPAVSAHVSVVRTSDAKLIGQWNPDQKGGNFSKCTSLTADIADMIYKEQFEAK